MINKIIRKPADKRKFFIKLVAIVCAALMAASIFSVVLFL